jgi:hypothetical protein
MRNTAPVREPNGVRGASEAAAHGRTRRDSDDACEERHRPLRSLVWQLFGAFVAVVLALAMAVAGHMTLKADADDVQLIEVRTRELETQFGQIRGDLGALRAGQDHAREELRYIRQVLDEERKK